jgi:hypothetical protein
MPPATRASDARARRSSASQSIRPRRLGKPLRHRDVLGDRHPVDQAQVLVDEGDRCVLARIVGLAVAAHVAGIGCIDPGQHLDERRLAGAVLAEQRQNLAREKVEVDVVDGERAAEALGHAVKRQDRLRIIRRPACSRCLQRHPLVSPWPPRRPTASPSRL